MPEEFCYKMAVLLEVTWFYPVDLSCPGHLVRMLKYSIPDYFQIKKNAEIAKYIIIKQILLNKSFNIQTKNGLEHTLTVYAF